MASRKNVLTAPLRDRSLRIQMAPEEVRMLKELAIADGTTASDIVRRLIRREHAKLSKR